MTTITYIPHDNKNFGIAAEHGLCEVFGIVRTAHDNSSYCGNSDICVSHMAISVKASAFTLMSASLCGGCEDFDGIWAIYEANTHSNTFAYCAKTGVAYMMDIAEFKQFVYAFCTLARESAKNGGGMKIRCRKESQKMLRWLDMRVAA